MNKIAILLRSTLNVNKFSETIISALNDQTIDNALLCSGFFQEDASYSVSSNRFSAVVRGHAPLNLTTVGYYSNRDKQKYQSFISGLRHIFPSTININPRRIPGDRWHAKVFIAKAGAKPVVAAIGSSNITRRAFDTIVNFNYECDVIFWDETNSRINGLMLEILGKDAQEFPSVIVSTYDETHPTSKEPLEKRLKSLENEILGASIDFK